MPPSPARSAPGGAPSTRPRPAALALAALAVLLAACSTRPAGDPAAAAAWAGARQLVLVTVADADAVHGRLQRYRRERGAWRSVGPAVPVVVGRSGIAWGRGLHPPQPGPAKREGDGRAPAGVFRIGHAFGYAPAHPTALPYRAMDAHDWCIDVPGSPLYNRIVDAREVGAEAIAGSTEPMRRDLHKNGDQRYRLGFVIEHNADAADRAGSCIFAHEWASPDTPTAGCTAMAPADMEALLAWLEPSADPVFVLLAAADHARLHARWGLPAPAGP
jgi:L,D-peptidoglycan transpeptidase YkuD (ErfK/YbiS/YcfS/YnhG family)